MTVKAGEINEKIREGKNRRMRKDLVGLYYLSHIDYVLVLYNLLCLVCVFFMVYRW